MGLSGQEKIMVYVLYNTSAGAHYGVDRIKEKMSEFFPGEEINLSSALSVDDKADYVSHLTPEDKLVVVGGDGTLNRFANSIEDKEYPFPMYCYAGGTGNDFINDVSGVDSDGLVQINEYIKKLPVITVNGGEYRFINGIGYGIDGWCCEVGDKYREKTGKAPNYTSIALSGLLGKFKPTHAKITIDGKVYEFDHVWMAPAMNGRYFGGGMMITPTQDRLNAARDLSVAVIIAKSRFKLLTIFPKIFKGKHTTHTDVYKLYTGKEVTVEFDRPVALQIDGETVLGVTSYTAKSASLLEKELVTK